MIQTSYHFIGIGGIGMSGLARLLIEKGQKVSGSDLSANYVTEALSQAGASVYIGHAAKQVEQGATVIYSSDIPEDNPELVEAKRVGCSILHRSDLLLKLMNDYKILAVTGTHGKTTTTSLLTHVFRVAQLQPAFAVGGLMNDLQSNAGGGGGDYFIVEADESDGTFLKYSYDGAIITNIDTDHLSYFGSWDSLVSAFKKFINNSRNPQLLFYCEDDQTLPALCKQGISYGFSETAQVRASRFRQIGWKILIDISFDGRDFPDVEIGLTGQHNALNALAVFGLSYRLGIEEKAIRKGLSSFGGVKRRLEKKGEINDILVLDDYAHHPTEIAATLKALRQAVGTKRIIAVFQPHRYSRMRFLLNDFAQAFNEADTTIITDLYAANETPVPLVNAETIIENINKQRKNPVVYLPRKSLVEDLAALLQPGDVVITLGAGDITKVGSELIVEKMR